jgi:hypothetical protein
MMEGPPVTPKKMGSQGANYLELNENNSKLEFNPNIAVNTNGTEIN